MRNGNGPMGDVLWQLYALVRFIESCVCAGYCEAEKIVCLSKGKMVLCIPGAYMMSPASAFVVVKSVGSFNVHVLEMC
jgi:hypothetical protein